MSSSGKVLDCGTNQRYKETQIYDPLRGAKVPGICELESMDCYVCEDKERVPLCNQIRQIEARRYEQMKRMTEALMILPAAMSAVGCAVLARHSGAQALSMFAGQALGWLAIFPAAGFPGLAGFSITDVVLTAIERQTGKNPAGPIGQWFADTEAGKYVYNRWLKD